MGGKATATNGGIKTAAIPSDAGIQALEKLLSDNNFNFIKDRFSLTEALARSCCN